MKAPQTHVSAERHLNSVVAALRAAAALNARTRSEPNQPPVPFVTISREAGAGGRTLARRLVEALNAADSEAWHAWDYELVEKVSAEHHIPQDVVADLEDKSRPWFQQFLDSLTVTGAHQHVEELEVYRRVATTVRALAKGGRAVIVGRGGMLITADMPGGIHLRLVAPLEHRIKNMARRLEVPLHDAAKRVAETDRNREQFFRRFWPDKKLSPELFTLTINTADLTDRQIVECVLPLVLHASERAEADEAEQRAACRCGHDRAPADFGTAVGGAAR